MSETDAVLVRLTKNQRGALRACAAIAVDTGEGGRTLKGALAALDAAVPAFSPGEVKALSDSADWYIRRSAREGLLQKIRGLAR